MRPLALGLLAILVFAAGTLALSTARTAEDAPAVIVAATPLTTADPAVTARTDPVAERGRLAIDERADRRRIRVGGLRLPMAEVPLPADDELLPNAERGYRAGWHEGIDFPATAGTPVHAVGAGTIARIDSDFADWDADAESAALEEATLLGYTPSATLDRIRGRQVWIDHGGGVVTRYAHLGSVAALAVGDTVAAGDVIGTVGSSGYPEGGPHLHLEVRVGASYLGDGLSGDALHAAIEAAFD